MADDKAFLLPVVIDATLDASARVPEKFREVQWTHLPDGRSSATFAAHVQRLLSGGAAPAAVTSARAVPMTAAAPAVATPPQEFPSIAVLPFVNRSSSAEDEYFSDGLADELLNVLAKIRGLRVAARTSSFQFKGKNDDIAVIGRKLNVATVLEGSVRKAGSRMRIAVQLVNVADGYHLWSETYDRTFDDIFAVQDDIAQSVVQELRTRLLGASGRRQGQPGGDGPGRGRGEGSGDRPRGAPALPASTLPRPTKQSRRHGKGDRLPEAGAGAGSGVRPRVGRVGRCLFG